MKRLLILSLLIGTVGAYAKTVARVLDANGNAFNFMSNKKVKQLIYGSKVEDASVVMVEDGGSLSLKDESGRVYHLSGGSQVKVFAKLLEIQKGNVWVSSNKVDSIGTISTGNSVVKYTQGQFIYSFDNYGSKSQVMVLTGNVQLSNSVEPGLLVEVPAGHFSFVDNEVNNGMPRGATRVGLSSYKSARGLFVGNELIKHNTYDKAFMGKSSTPKREIASVKESSPKKMGKILFIKSTKRKPASAGPSIMKYYKSVVNHKPKVKKVPKVEMRVFGLNGVTKSVSKKVVTKKTEEPVVLEGSFFQRRIARKKAALAAKEKAELKRISDQKKKMAQVAVKKARKPASLTGYEKGASIFEKSLRESEVENRRHSSERNSLIDELESYNKNYKKQY